MNAAVCQKPRVRVRRFAVAILLSAFVPCSVPCSPCLARPGPGVQQVTFTPQEIGTSIFQFPNAVVGTQPTVAAFQHGYLFIGSGGLSGTTNFINWYDLSNPRAPSFVDQIPTIGNKPHMSAFWDDKMLDGYHDHRVLRIWDFDDRELFEQFTGSVNTLSYMGQIPYVYRSRNGYGTGGATMEVIDVSDPSNPFIATVLDLGQWVNFMVGSTHAVGNLFICTASQAKGVAVFDISNPLNPILRDVVVTGRDIYTSALYGSRVYACEQENGIRVYDFSNPDDLSVVGFVDFPNSPRYVEFKDGKGYTVPGSNRLHLFDAQTLAPLESHALPARSDFALAVGNLIVTGGGDETNNAFLLPIEENPDTQGPAVTFAHPQDGDIGVGLRSRVGMVMSERVDVTSLTATTFLVRPAGGGAGSSVSGTYSTQHGMSIFR